MQKPRLGQNFLVDADACRAVSAALGNIRESAVLEIGPGRGAITRLLARAAGHLTLVEYDPALAAMLREEFASQPAVEVRHADILGVDLTALAKDRVPHPERSDGWDVATAGLHPASSNDVPLSSRTEEEVRHADILGIDLAAPAKDRVPHPEQSEGWDVATADLYPASSNDVPLSSQPAESETEGSAARKLVVVGNLPYYITSDILLHMVEHHAVIDRAVLMVQREVAERITARPGTSEYGVLSATMQLYGEVELLFTLPPAAFAPRPEVHSSVFRWNIRPRFAELGITAGEFVPFMRASFAQKRKTWANNLRNAGYGDEAVAAALELHGLPATIRAEAVDLEQMAAVFRRLRQQGE